jgi:hypothetical protein
VDIPPRVFLATLDDLRPGLERLESGHPVEYLLKEELDEDLFVRRASLRDDPQLGLSATGSPTTDPDFFVYPQGHQLAVRKIERNGAVKYVPQGSPESMLFRPGGLHEASGALVPGRLERGFNPSAAGKLLHDAFASEIFAGFKKIRGFFVGPAAYRALKEGQRLATQGVKQPPGFDLADVAP